MLAYSVVRRHMKRTSEGSFTVFDGAGELPVPLTLDAGETVIGWYQNPSPWEHCVFIFTSEALCLVDNGRVDRILIRDVVGYESPKTKADVTGVRVLTKSGFHFVRVAGSFGPNGNQKDAFSFSMAVRALIPGKPTIRYPNETEGQDGVK